MISVAFKRFPSTKSKWMRTEQMSSVWLICGFNYKWCAVMTVLGCDSSVLVSSPLTCCSCLSPQEETPFSLLPGLNHCRSVAGKAATARGAGGAERAEQSWGHRAERGLSGAPHAAGEARWSCSLRCGQECCEEAEEQRHGLQQDTRATPASAATSAPEVFGYRVKSSSNRC